MQLFFAAVLLATATFTAAMPVSSNPAREFAPSLSKRDSYDCSVNAWPRLTQARAADIAAELINEDVTWYLTNEQSDIILCKGGTGVIASIDANDGVQYAFNSYFLGSLVRNVYDFCYDEFPSSGAGDNQYAAAYQYWGSGWNVLVRGSLAC